MDAHTDTYLHVPACNWLFCFLNSAAPCWPAWNRHICCCLTTHDIEHIQVYFFQTVSRRFPGLFEMKRPRYQVLPRWRLSWSCGLRRGSGDTAWTLHLEQILVVCDQASGQLWLKNRRSQLLEQRSFQEGEETICHPVFEISDHWYEIAWQWWKKYWEHSVSRNVKWKQFTCVQENLSVGRRSNYFHWQLVQRQIAKLSRGVWARAIE